MHLSLILYIQGDENNEKKFTFNFVCCIRSSPRLVMDSFTLSIERLSLQCGIIKPRKKAKLCR